MCSIMKKTSVPSASIYMSMGLSSNTNSLYSDDDALVLLLIMIDSFLIEVFHLPTTYESLTVLLVMVEGSMIGIVGMLIGVITLSTT